MEKCINMDFYTCRWVQFSDLIRDEVLCKQTAVNAESPLVEIEPSLLAEELLTVDSFLGRESQILLAIMVPVRQTMFFHWMHVRELSEN